MRREGFLDLDQRDEIQTVGARHRETQREEDCIGGPRKHKRTRAISSFPNNIEVAGKLERRAQALPHDSVRIRYCRLDHGKRSWKKLRSSLSMFLWIRMSNAIL